MAGVKIFWDPQGFELDSVSDKRYLGPPADGDTPDAVALAQWLPGQAPVSDGLSQHLHPRLTTGQAGSLQEQ